MNSIIIIVAVILIIAYVVAQERAKWRKKQPQSAKYSYNRKKFFMTKPEHEFYDLLIKALGVDYIVFAQVHLSTILDHKVKGQSWGGALSHINSKSVDFVVCDKVQISPLLAIELDDSSHDKQDRKTRDEEVERMFHQADLTLLRFTNRGTPDNDDISRRLKEALNISTKTEQ